MVTLLTAHDLLGLAHRAVTRPVPDGVDVAPARDLVRRWGWAEHACDSATLAALAQALSGLASAGFDLPPSGLDRYARAMQGVAEADVGGVPTDSPEAAMRYVVLGRVLMEPVLLAMRRLAQQSASLQRFGAGELSAKKAGELSPAEPASRQA